MEKVSPECLLFASPADDMLPPRGENETLF